MTIFRLVGDNGACLLFFTTGIVTGGAGTASLGTVGTEIAGIMAGMTLDFPLEFARNLRFSAEFPPELGG